MKDNRQKISNCDRIISEYYDGHVAGKIKGYVEGNPRVESAWRTVCEWAGKAPDKILEVGCGIGDVCWRMSRLWPQAEIVGVDISPESLNIARQLFPSPRISFVDGGIPGSSIGGPFDLIVLMDVYEHVPVQERTVFNRSLREARGGQGRMILSFPTPRHQAWLREFKPELLQPVEEDIDLSMILALAGETATEVLAYREVDVWHEGDYAHAVLGTRTGWVAISKAVFPRRRVRDYVRSLLNEDEEPLVPSREKRCALVRQQLGFDAYPGPGRKNARPSS